MSEMKLPEGKTCNDCVHCYQCTRMFGVKPENTECDFFPIRFVHIPVSRSAQAELEREE